MLVEKEQPNVRDMRIDKVMLSGQSPKEEPD